MTRAAAGQKHHSGTGAGIASRSRSTHVFRGRDVVFVDPLDDKESHWWPAMIVPVSEIDSTMDCSILNPGECLVKYFEDNKYSVVPFSDIQPFIPTTIPFLEFEAKVGQKFLKNGGVVNALAYLETGRVKRRFSWQHWGTAPDQELDLDHKRDKPVNVPLASISPATSTASTLSSTSSLQSSEESLGGAATTTSTSAFSTKGNHSTATTVAVASMMTGPSLSSTATKDVTSPRRLRRVSMDQGFLTSSEDQDVDSESDSEGAIIAAEKTATSARRGHRPRIEMVIPLETQNGYPPPPSEAGPDPTPEDPTDRANEVTVGSSKAVASSSGKEASSVPPCSFSSSSSSSPSSSSSSSLPPSSSASALSAAAAATATLAVNTMVSSSSASVQSFHSPPMLAAGSSDRIDSHPGSNNLGEHDGESPLMIAASAEASTSSLTNFNSPLLTPTTAPPTAGRRSKVGSSPPTSSPKKHRPVPMVKGTKSASMSSLPPASPAKDRQKEEPTTQAEHEAKLTPVKKSTRRAGTKSETAPIESPATDKPNGLTRSRQTRSTTESPTKSQSASPSISSVPSSATTAVVGDDTVAIADTVTHVTIALDDADPAVANRTDQATVTDRATESLPMGRPSGKPPLPKHHQGLMNGVTKVLGSRPNGAESAEKLAEKQKTVELGRTIKLDMDLGLDCNKKRESSYEVDFVHSTIGLKRTRSGTATLNQNQTDPDSPSFRIKTLMSPAELRNARGASPSSGGSSANGQPPLLTDPVGPAIKKRKGSLKSSALLKDSDTEAGLAGSPKLKQKSAAGRRGSLELSKALAGRGKHHNVRNATVSDPMESSEQDSESRKSPNASDTNASRGTPAILSTTTAVSHGASGKRVGRGAGARVKGHEAAASSSGKKGHGVKTLGDKCVTANHGSIADQQIGEASEMKDSSNSPDSTVMAGVDSDTTQSSPSVAASTPATTSTGTRTTRTAGREAKNMLAAFRQQPQRPMTEDEVQEHEEFRATRIEVINSFETVLPTLAVRSKEREQFYEGIMEHLHRLQREHQRLKRTVEATETEPRKRQSTSIFASASRRQGLGISTLTAASASAQATTNGSSIKGLRHEGGGVAGAGSTPSPAITASPEGKDDESSQSSSTTTTTAAKGKHTNNNNTKRQLLQQQHQQQDIKDTKGSSQAHSNGTSTALGGRRSSVSSTSSSTSSSIFTPVILPTTTRRAAAAAAAAAVTSMTLTPFANMTSANSAASSLSSVAAATAAMVSSASNTSTVSNYSPATLPSSTSTLTTKEVGGAKATAIVESVSDSADPSPSATPNGAINTTTASGRRTNGAAAAAKQKASAAATRAKRRLR